MRKALFTAALIFASACGPGVPILMYHSVSDRPDPYAISEKDFTAHLDYLKGSGFNTVSLHEVLDNIEDGARLPPNPIVITFDDGHLDNHAVVLPLLKERGQRATFFLVTRFLGQDEGHRRVEEKGTGRERKFLLWSEVRELSAAGMEIGSHSLHHKKLTALPLHEVKQDVATSRNELEAALGKPVEFFAYPFNSEHKHVRRVVQSAGYRAAVAGAHGLGDKFQLNRIAVFKGMTARDLRARLDEGWASGFTGGN